jgi:O-antigen/teichoic acid export membrane protein
MERAAKARHLVMIAIAGQAVGYILVVLMARRLGVAGFEAYAVASAAFILLATFAPRGAEKYALRQLPAMLQQAQAGRARGLLRFGVRRTLATALASGVAVGAASAWGWREIDETRLAMIVTCLSLPAGALAHYGVEVLTAVGRPRLALAIFKLFVPSLALIFVTILLAASGTVSGAAAVGCWGVAWVVAVAMMALAFRRSAPPEMFTAAQAPDLATWRAETRPFFVYRVSLALLGQGGVIALELLHPSGVAVGAYAAAMGTVAMASVLATSTNRAYGRDLALVLDRRDFETLLVLRRRRLGWMAPAMALFLVVTFGFSQQVLGLFRPEFAQEGVAALRILAVSTAFTVLFSLAPTYLKFQKRNATTYGVMAAAAGTQLVLLAALVPAFGAVGAASAYALSMCGMYGTFAILAHREVVALKAAARHPPSGGQP